MKTEKGYGRWHHNNMYSAHWTVHIKGVKTVNFLQHGFYHNSLKKWTGWIYKNWINILNKHPMVICGERRKSRVIEVLNECVLLTWA